MEAEHTELSSVGVQLRVLRRNALPNGSANRSLMKGIHTAQEEKSQHVFVGVAKKGQRPIVRAGDGTSEKEWRYNRGGCRMYKK